METFGQVGCSVRRPARSGWAQARWVGFHPLFRGGRCNRGVVPLPIRFTARKDGDLRSGRVLGEDAGTIIFVSVRAQPHDQDGGDLRSGRVLGQETTHPFHGGHRRHDQDGGDLRSDRVLDWGRWRPSVRSRARSGDYPSISWRAQAARSKVSRRGKMETFGQVACSVGRLPIHFTVAQVARSG